MKQSDNNFCFQFFLFFAALRLIIQHCCIHPILVCYIKINNHNFLFGTWKSILNTQLTILMSPKKKNQLTQWLRLLWSIKIRTSLRKITPVIHVSIAFAATYGHAWHVLNLRLLVAFFSLNFLCFLRFLLQTIILANLHIT